MNNIIDPYNLQSYSIFSDYGKYLLKQYIQYYQSGGSGGGGAAPRRPQRNIPVGVIHAMRKYGDSKTLGKLAQTSKFAGRLIPQPIINKKRDEDHFVIKHDKGINKSFYMPKTYTDVQIQQEIQKKYYDNRIPDEVGITLAKSPTTIIYSVKFWCDAYSDDGRAPCNSWYDEKDDVRGYCSQYCYDRSQEDSDSDSSY
jgi:hypothetical protein